MKYVGFIGVCYIGNIEILSKWIIVNSTKFKVKRTLVSKETDGTKRLRAL